MSKNRQSSVGVSLLFFWVSEAKPSTWGICHLRSIHLDASKILVRILYSVGGHVREEGRAEAYRFRPETDITENIDLHFY